MVRKKKNILFMKFIIAGKTTQVKVNILIRSMGPISEMKMVELVIKCEKGRDLFIPGLLHGLLLPPVLERRETELQGKSCTVFPLLAYLSLAQGLKNNANNLVINQLSLNVAMLKKIWKPGELDMVIHVKLY